MVRWRRCVRFLVQVISSLPCLHPHRSTVHPFPGMMNRAPEVDTDTVSPCCRTLRCGHPCRGVRGEESCPPCLNEHCFTSDSAPNSKCPICLEAVHGSAEAPDADDEDEVSDDERPSVQLECGHIYHFECIRTQVRHDWRGRRIAFEFLYCWKCKPNLTLVQHNLLDKYLHPLSDLRQNVESMAKQQLEKEGRADDEPLRDVEHRFYQGPVEYAMSLYAYYQCHKCKTPFFGGAVVCTGADDDESDPSTLLCLSCTHLNGIAVCDKHGLDGIEYKCRFCCSIAAHICPLATSGGHDITHFCEVCYEEPTRSKNWHKPKDELPSCPVAPGGIQMYRPAQCALSGIVHPSPGVEFVLGCVLCRSEASG